MNSLSMLATLANQTGHTTLFRFLHGTYFFSSCSDISLTYCKNVLCDLNPQFYCTVDKYKCVCPSCDAQKNPSQCPTTRYANIAISPYATSHKNEFSGNFYELLLLATATFMP